MRAFRGAAEKRLILGPGDLLLPYTDGVTEALRSDGTEFGVVGLQSTAASVRHRSANEIMQRIAQAVDAFTAGEPQFDDLTYLVLKRTMGTVLPSPRDITSAVAEVM